MKLQIIFLEILRKLKTKNKSDFLKYKKYFQLPSFVLQSLFFCGCRQPVLCLYQLVLSISPEQGDASQDKKTKCNENLSKDYELESCGLEARDIKKLDNKINLLNSTKGGFHFIRRK